ncbi:transglutaminase TgpA family protein [Gracilibacillus salinarum]|uniref:DUF3488 and DUF4129 domain-containing transglutaminase family protein n=1 Tax=Gracilibacillus salinarum TaxID=2932255 RepID=A0ABY4GJ50_9BACI|nr:transglutaminaseTgpA domain-containing protein [Gracilibacillus salinarum]UOQ84383.1 DUF3488 and DUF4129 domain-containing transglutaminase family protein [Gracilibacillus salinarum]
MKKQFSLETVSTFILLCAGFLLFWEWLRPLEQTTDTGNSYLFVIFTAICFAVSFFTENKIARFAVKLVSMLFVLDYLFVDARFLSSEWVQFMQLEWQFNLEIIFENNMAQMTAFFRSMLFLIVLWLMSYLLHYWFTVANKFFLFVVLTFFYLAVLDTFTVYDARLAIVRTFVISFVVFGLSRYVHLMKQVEKRNYKQQVVGWMLPIMLIVGLATALGIYSPKPDPQWPDPVPFIQSTAGHVGFSGGVQKVGYGEDDSRLGGSFVQDDTPVFRAIAHDDIYWRIETKDVYTGKGWERSTELNYQPLTNGMIADNTFLVDQVETTAYQGQVEPVDSNALTKAVYPYGVQMLNTSGQSQFYMDAQSGLIESESAEENIAQAYSVQYEAPSFSVNQLQELPTDDPAAIRDQYLQLPNSLPDRVRELASDITEGVETRYEKARAIEGYFAANGYRYQIEDVSVPERGEDYVDQFLFETQIGYCDNFSTSMVVLLRSLDIPARWVKGFTGGSEIIDQRNLPEGYSTYEVTNNNAHSWVEVYFPGTGWVPFEPTSGFNNPTDFYQEVTSDVDVDNPEEEQTETEETEQEEAAEEQEQKQQLTEEDGSGDTAAAGQDNGDGNMRYLWIAAALIILAVTVLAYLKRYEIRNWYILRKWRRLREKSEVEAAYLYLLEILGKQGLRRKTGQTLRQYANEVDEHFGTTAMSTLTAAYEEYLYRNQTSIDKDEKRLQELFDELSDQIFA